MVVEEEVGQFDLVVVGEDLEGVGLVQDLTLDVEVLLQVGLELPVGRGRRQGLVPCGLEDRGEAVDGGAEFACQPLGDVLGLLRPLPGRLEPAEDGIGVEPRTCLPGGPS